MIGGFLIIGLIYIFINSKLLLKDPVVFPDETSFATVSYSLINPKVFSHDWFSTHLGQTEIAEIIYHGPVYYLYLAGLFKIFGFGISEMRWGSVLLGGLALIWCFKLARMTGKNMSSGWLLIFLLGSDYFFLRTSRFGRPEMMVIWLSVVGLVNYFSWLKKQSKWSLWATFVAMILTFMSHYLMGSALILSIFVDRILKNKNQILKDKFSWIFGLSFSTVIFVWILIISRLGQNIDKALSAGGSRFNPSFRSIQAIMAGDELIKLVAIVYLVGLIWATLVKFKTRQEKLLIIFAWLSIVLMIFGGLDWYLGFLPLAGSFGYLVLDRSWLKKNQINQRYSMLIVLVVVIFFNLAEQTRIAMFYRDYDYEVYAKSVADYLPDEAKVWVSQLIPDPSLYLAKNRPDLKLVLEEYKDFSLIHTKQQLSQSEYIVQYWLDNTAKLPDQENIKSLINQEIQTRNKTSQIIPPTIYTPQLTVTELSSSW